MELDRRVTTTTTTTFSLLPIDRERKIYHHHHHHLSRLSQSEPNLLRKISIQRRWSWTESHQNQIRMPSADIFQQRYPQAKIDMEENLLEFIRSFEICRICSENSSLRFLHQEIVELAEECLSKSRSHSMTTVDFNELTDHLQTFLFPNNVIEHIQTLVKRFLLVIARSARLLEYLQFNPEEYRRTTIHDEIPSPTEEDFEVIKLISNGAYGAVHLVKHRRTQERHAIKKISKIDLIHRNEIEQVFLERDIMTLTNNSFVVSLFCTFETKNSLCLVMEYVEGGDVATLLKNINGPLNLDVARMYFVETTLAVEYLHSHDIIHRDLKPDNLLITASGHIKLTDFGLSKIGLMSQTTNYYEKQICGTPSYIAPEVILRQVYGKAVDWWSLGIILYEFLVGIPPFIGNTPDELFANVIDGKIDWENSSDEIETNGKNLIERLLIVDPIRRLENAEKLREHPFCSSIDWSNVLREKGEFVPVLESPDDTSYFDTREDRYQHSEENDSTTDTESDSLFASFSSVSLKYVSEFSSSSRMNSIASDSNDDEFDYSDDQRSPIFLQRQKSTFGFTFRTTRQRHTNEHFVDFIDQTAERSGLQLNDEISHIDGTSIVAFDHSDVMKILSNASNQISLNVVRNKEKKCKISPSKKSLFRRLSERKVALAVASRLSRK